MKTSTIPPALALVLLSFALAAGAQVVTDAEVRALFLSSRGRRRRRRPPRRLLFPLRLRR
jgi:hypothetical protein